MTRTAKWSIGIASGITLALAMLFLTGNAYQSYWLRGAEGAVTGAADSLARGESVRRLAFYDFADRVAISHAFGSGFDVASYDNIGLGFRAYEVRIRVANGDLYNFDAYHREGEWHLSCCIRLASTELP